MLLTEEEITELWKQLNKQYPKLDSITSIREGGKAQLKKMVEYIEKYVYYVDKRGYVALKPDATKNWQTLLDGVNLG